MPWRETQPRLNSLFSKLPFKTAHNVRRFQAWQLAHLVVLAWCRKQLSQSLLAPDSPRSAIHISYCDPQRHFGPQSSEVIWIWMLLLIASNFTHKIFQSQKSSIWVPNWEFCEQITRSSHRGDFKKPFPSGQVSCSQPCQNYTINPVSQFGMQKLAAPVFSTHPKSLGSPTCIMCVYISPPRGHIML